MLDLWLTARIKSECPIILQFWKQWTSFRVFNDLCFCVEISLHILHYFQLEFTSVSTKNSEVEIDSKIIVICRKKVSFTNVLFMVTGEKV